MDKKNFVEESSPQDRIDILEKRYANIREHPPMEILFNAAKEYLLEKGQEKNGS